MEQNPNPLWVAFKHYKYNHLWVVLKYYKYNVLRQNQGVRVRKIKILWLNVASEASLKKMKALAQVVLRAGHHGCTKLTALSWKPKLHCCTCEMFS